MATDPYKARKLFGKQYKLKHTNKKCTMQIISYGKTLKRYSVQ